MTIRIITRTAIQQVSLHCNQLADFLIGNPDLARTQHHGMFDRGHPWLRQLLALWRSAQERAERAETVEEVALCEYLLGLRNAMVLAFGVETMTGDQFAFWRSLEKHQKQIGESYATNVESLVAKLRSVESGLLGAMAKDAERSARPTERPAAPEGAPAGGDGKSADLTAMPTPAVEFRFLRKGDFWDLAFGDESTLVKGSKGLEHIALLLESPNPQHPIAALEMDKRGPATQSADHSFQPVLDDHTKHDYRKRLEEIRGERAKAERDNDEARIRILDKEVSQIESDSRAATGLHGKDRELGPSSPERTAMDAVRKTINRAIAAIAKNMPQLAIHLRDSIKPEDSAWAYRPGPTPPAWHVEA